MKTIQTERLVLRSLTLDDLDDFHHYCKKETVGPNAGWMPHANPKISLQILKMMISGKEVWGIEFQNKLIGTIGLHLRDKKFIKYKIREVGYSLDDTYWGLGIATEACLALMHYAFYELKLEKLYVGHTPSNIASQKVIVKCGFEYFQYDYRPNYLDELVEVWMYEITSEKFKEINDAKNKI